MLRALREHSPHVPVIILTGAMTAPVVYGAAALGAQFVVKPAPTTVLRAFESRLSERMAPHEVAREVERAVHEFGLSPSEARILEAAVLGAGRDEIPERLGLAENTIKTQVRGLVTKCEVFQLNDVVRLVWERVAKPKE